MEIKANTIGEAHLKVCQKIFMDGTELRTEDGEITFEYPEPVIIIVEHPNIQPRISKFNNFNEQKMEVYKKQFTSITNSGFAYTYGNRMFDYPITDEYFGDDEFADNICVYGDGEGGGFDQIEWVVNTLVKNPESRRAIAIIRDPEIDCKSTNPPCLTTVQFFIRDNAIHCVAYFRSNDMLSAWCNNANGLFALMDKVGKEIFDRTKDFPDDERRRYCGGTGMLTTISASAHIYFERDAEELKNMKRQIYSW